MTVKELIEELKKLEHQDAAIMIEGYEGGFDDVGRIQFIEKVALNYYDASYLGKHKELSFHDEKEEYEVVPAYVIYEEE